MGGQDPLGGLIDRNRSCPLVEQDHTAEDPVQRFLRGTRPHLRGLDSGMDHQGPLEVGNQRTNRVEILITEGPGALLPEADQVRERLPRTLIVEKGHERMGSALGAHPVVVELGPPLLAFGKDAVGEENPTLLCLRSEGAPRVQAVEVRAVGFLMVLIDSGGGEDSAVTIVGVTKDEMDARKPQLVAEGLQKHRPALRRHRSLIDSIDMGFQAG